MQMSCGVTKHTEMNHPRVQIKHLDPLTPGAGGIKIRQWVGQMENAETTQIIFHCGRFVHLKDSDVKLYDWEQLFVMFKIELAARGTRLYSQSIYSRSLNKWISFNSFELKRDFKVVIICSVLHRLWHYDLGHRDWPLLEYVAPAMKIWQTRCICWRKATKAGAESEQRKRRTEQQSEQNKQRNAASRISSVTLRAALLKHEVTTDNQLVGGRPNFQRRAAEIKHLICTEVNNHILYGAII